MPSNLQNNLIEKYDTFLFDWDGTIADTWKEWIAVMLKIWHEEYGLTNTTEKDAIDNIGYWDSPVRVGLDKSRFDLAVYQEICSSYSSHVATSSKIYVGARELIELIKSKGKKLAIVTSSTRLVIDEAIISHNFTNVFDCVVSADDVYAHKPDPEPITLALNTLNCDPKTAVMFGDSAHDLLAAERAGVDSVFFCPAGNFHIDRELVISEVTPTYEISNWNQLLEFVE